MSDYPASGWNPMDQTFFDGVTAALDNGAIVARVMGYAYQWGDSYSGPMKWTTAGATERLDFNLPAVVTDGLVSGEFVEHISNGVTRTFPAEDGANDLKVEFTPTVNSIVTASITGYDDGGDGFIYHIDASVEDNPYNPAPQHGAIDVYSGLSLSFLAPAGKLSSVRFWALSTGAQEVGSMVATVVVTPLTAAAP